MQTSPTLSVHPSEQDVSRFCTWHSDWLTGSQPSQCAAIMGRVRRKVRRATRATDSSVYLRIQLSEHIVVRLHTDTGYLRDWARDRKLSRHTHRLREGETGRGRESEGVIEKRRKQADACECSRRVPHTQASHREPLPVDYNLAA